MTPKDYPKQFAAVAAGLLSATFAANAFAGAAKEPTCPAKTRINSLREKGAMIPHPKSTKNLVENIKFALENELLWNEAFYAEENLKNVLGGGKAIEQSMNDPAWQRVWITDYAEVAKPLSIKPEDMYLYGIFIDRRKMGSGNRIIHSRLTPLPDKTLNYQAVKQLFAGWKQINATDPTHRHWAPGTTPPPSKPHGLERLVFINTSRCLKHSISFEFDEREYLAAVEIREGF
jgi:hypothetical protein